MKIRTAAVLLRPLAPGWLGFADIMTSFWAIKDKTKKIQTPSLGHHLFKLIGWDLYNLGAMVYNTRHHHDCLLCLILSCETYHMWAIVFIGSFSIAHNVASRFFIWFSTCFEATKFGLWTSRPPGSLWDRPLLRQFTRIGAWTWH